MIGTCRSGIRVLPFAVKFLRDGWYLTKCYVWFICLIQLAHVMKQSVVCGVKGLLLANPGTLVSELTAVI